jgi:hypothetical protein
VKAAICLYLAFAAGLSACAKPVPTKAVSTQEARDNIHAWNGRDVIVEGWLGTCQGYDCHIFRTLADAQIVAKGNPKTKEWRSAMDRSLGIGSATNFDELAAPLQFQEVQIFGRLSDACRGWFTGCTDRISDIQPANIGLAKLYKKVN